MIEMNEPGMGVRSKHHVGPRLASEEYRSEQPSRSKLPIVARRDLSELRASTTWCAVPSFSPRRISNLARYGGRKPLSLTSNSNSEEVSDDVATKSRWGLYMVAKGFLKGIKESIKEFARKGKRGCGKRIVSGVSRTPLPRQVVLNSVDCSIRKLEIRFLCFIIPFIPFSAHLALLTLVSPWF